MSFLGGGENSFCRLSPRKCNEFPAKFTGRFLNLKVIQSTQVKPFELSISPVSETADLLPDFSPTLYEFVESNDSFEFDNSIYLWITAIQFASILFILALPAYSKIISPDWQMAIFLEDYYIPETKRPDPEQLKFHYESMLKMRIIRRTFKGITLTHDDWLKLNDDWKHRFKYLVKEESDSISEPDSAKESKLKSESADLGN